MSTPPKAALFTPLVADERIEVGVGHTPAGERLVTVLIPRLEVALAIGLEDAAGLARALAGATQRALILNQQDEAPETPGSSIILPPSQH